MDAACWSSSIAYIIFDYLSLYYTTLHYDFSAKMEAASLPCMKVIVIGDGNVGKTSLLRRFVRGEFVEEYRRTIGAEYMDKDVYLRSRNATVKLVLWDTAGQEMFSPLTVSYYRNSSAAIICFSTIDKDSFHHALEWKNQVEQVCGSITMVLCQTKFDLSHEAVVTTEECEALSTTLSMPFFRVSTKDDYNITQLFEFTAQTILETAEEQGATQGEGTSGTGVGGAQPGGAASPAVNLNEKPKKKKKCCLK